MSEPCAPDAPTKPLGGLLPRTASGWRRSSFRDSGISGSCSLGSVTADRKDFEELVTGTFDDHSKAIQSLCEKFDRMERSYKATTCLLEDRVANLEECLCSEAPDKVDLEERIRLLEDTCQRVGPEPAVRESGDAPGDMVDAGPSASWPMDYMRERVPDGDYGKAWLDRCRDAFDLRAEDAEIDEYERAVAEHAE